MSPLASAIGFSGTTKTEAVPVHAQLSGDKVAIAMRSQILVALHLNQIAAPQGLFDRPVQGIPPHPAAAQLLHQLLVSGPVVRLFCYVFGEC